jgi:hypothetical protein
MAWFRKRKVAEPADENPLRAMAFQVSEAEQPAAVESASDDVRSAIMEVAASHRVATLVVYPDGATSLYASSGGGVIGAGEHASVKQATAAWLESARGHLALFQPVTDTTVPTRGEVALYVKGARGLLGLRASEEALGEKQHPAWPVFYAAHGVITAIRELQPRN